MIPINNLGNCSENIYIFFFYSIVLSIILRTCTVFFFYGILYLTLTLVKILYFLLISFQIELLQTKHMDLFIKDAL